MGAITATPLDERGTMPRTLEGCVSICPEEEALRLLMSTERRVWSPELRTLGGSPRSVKKGPDLGGNQDPEFLASIQLLVFLTCLNTVSKAKP